ncbi:TDP-N-acetylfucosamine:lipid II N-acetylfucosaminyltransferase [Microbacterium paludicola]|uniref:TDP-N-acetylfucosamine:lipid II N-acetylfucosaminyltransferase n=1 Tax=Microbacterium paludicola TaxID=300019 RepID=UPI003879B5F8
MRILQIARDSQFSARFSSWFEEIAPGASEYLVSANTPDKELRYPIASDRVTVLGPGIRRLGGLRHIRSYDALVVHNMDNFAALLTTVSRRRATHVWSGYGWDYYGDGRSAYSGQLDPLTANLLAVGGGSRSLLRGAATAAKTALRNAAANRTDLFSAPIATDYEVFKQRFPRSRAEYIQLNYAVTTDLAGPGGSVSGEDVLVGNSADPTNNHLDLIELLTSVPLDGRRIIMPLSYGGDKAYIEAVMKAGKAAFGGAFEPLLERVPFEEYVQLMARCGHVVMGQRRQKALGNIIIALHGGADVILHDSSPVHAALAQEGAALRRLSDLRRDGFGPGRLSAAERAQNLLVLERLWGEPVVKQNVSNLIEVLGIGARQAPSS